MPTIVGKLWAKPCPQKGRWAQISRPRTASHKDILAAQRGILIMMDERDATDETSAWLSDHAGREAIAHAREELSDGKGLTEQQVRAEFGVPKRLA